MLNLIIIVSSVCLGFILSLFIYKFINSKRESSLSIKSDIKSELDSLLFEKSVALEALEKINSYYNEKKIDEFEKDRLLLKYTKLLEGYDNKIFKLRPILEVQEIYQYRNQLFTLFNEYIKKIDSKLSLSSKGMDNLDNSFGKRMSNKKQLMNADFGLDMTSSTNESKNENDDLKNMTNPQNLFQNLSTDKIIHYNQNNISELSDSDKNNGDSYNDLNKMYEKDKDADNNNFDTFDMNLNEINMIQKDILNTLKRLEES